MAAIEVPLNEKPLQFRKFERVFASCGISATPPEVKLLGAFGGSIRYITVMTRILVVALGLVLTSCVPPPPTGQQAPATELVGRVAGPPERCISIVSMHNLRISDSDPQLILYGNGPTIWANPLGPGCSFMRSDILVTEPTGSSYCRGDIVRSIDPISHIPGRTCVFGDFIPYRRP
jgi:hypothetical protein